MHEARLPVAGVIPNYNPAIGVDGIVGVKSGWTTEAGACLATAAYRSAGGHSVLVESVTLGQPGDLQAPAVVDEALLSYVGASSRAISALRVGQSDSVPDGQRHGNVFDAVVSASKPSRGRVSCSRR